MEIKNLDQSNSISGSFTNTPPLLSDNIDNCDTDNFYNNQTIQFTDIIEVCSYDQARRLFEIITSINNIQSQQLYFLYDFVVSKVIQMRTYNEAPFYNYAFEDYLSFEAITNIYRNRTDLLPCISGDSAYFNALSHYNKNTIIQSDALYDEHYFYKEQIKYIITHLNDDKLTQSENYRMLIKEIINRDHESKKYQKVVDYITSLYYKDGLDSDTSQNLQHVINETITANENAVEENQRSIVLELLKSLYSKDVETFKKAAKMYATMYLLCVKRMSQDELSDNIADDFSLSEKMEAFFAASYIGSFIKDLNLTSFFDMMMCHYDKDIFKAWINQFDIPLNACVRIEMGDDKNDDEKPKSVYPTMLEYAIYCGEMTLANDLVEAGLTLEDSFYAKVAEGDFIYHYQSEPFAHYSELFNEEQWMWAISKGLVHENTNVMLNDSDTTPSHILFHFLRKGWDNAFLYFYEKAKHDNPDFALNNLLTSYGNNALLIYVYYALHESRVVNRRILNIMVHEKMDIVNRANQNINEYLKGHANLYNVCLIISEIESLLPEVALQDTKEEGETVKSKSAPLIAWFDREKLLAHRDGIKKTKESSNIDLMKTLLEQNRHLKPNLFVEDESVFTQLNEEFPNFKEVIDFYKGQFRMKKLSNKVRVQPILLLGDPGIGKTYFAMKLAKYLNTGYTFVDMGSLSSSWVLSGANGTWKDAKQGKILDAMNNSPTINPVFVMDELDKMTGGNYPPSVVLYQLLEQINAKAFTDEFIDFPFDASGIIYVACANDVTNLSAPLLSRFKTFHVKNPDQEQIVKIIHNIYTEATESAGIFTPVLSDEVLNSLKTKPLRIIKGMIDEAISNALLQFSMEELNTYQDSGKKVELTAPHFNEPIKRTKLGF